MDYDTLKALALAHPAVEESTSYGTPALKVKGKLMVRLREDDETVVFRADWDRREEAMAVHPDVFFVTDHYRAHPWVLARLSSLTPGVTASMLDHAWRQVAPRTLLARVERNTPLLAARELVTGTILSGHEKAAVEVPFDPAERWQVAARSIREGRRGYPVRAHLAGVPFDSAIVPRSKRFWLIVDERPLAAAGVRVGDTVTIEMEPVQESA